MRCSSASGFHRTKNNSIGIVVDANQIEPIDNSYTLRVIKYYYSHTFPSVRPDGLQSIRKCISFSLSPAECCVFIRFHKHPRAMCNRTCNAMCCSVCCSCSRNMLGAVLVCVFVGCVLTCCDHCRVYTIVYKRSVHDRTLHARDHRTQTQMYRATTLLT